MADKTAIEWTDATWNPIRARNRATGGLGHFCEHMSEGCRFCYAERLQPRFQNPIRYARQDREKVDLSLDVNMLTQPLRWKKPRRIFVCSMTDLFADFVPDEWIDRIFAVMALCPQHTFQVLTKRSERMREYIATLPDTGEPDRLTEIAADIGHEFRRGHQGDAGACERPILNVWLGVSVEDQENADARIPHLLATPAAIRFLSCEPMLGPIDLANVRHRQGEHSFEIASVLKADDGFGLNRQRNRIDWVICGGESGPHARPMHPDWARSLREQCADAGVAFLFKQWGEWKPRDEWSPHLGGGRFERMMAIMPDGTECPDDIAPQDVGGQRIAHVGKKRAGRLLDGVEHSEFPG